MLQSNTINICFENAVQHILLDPEVLPMSSSRMASPKCHSAAALCLQLLLTCVQTMVHRLRTKNWVRVASKNTRQHQPPQQPKQSGMAASGANRTRVSQESGYGAYVQVAIRGSAPGNGRPPKGVDVDDEDDLYPGDDGGSGTAGGAEGGVGPYGRPGAGSVEGSEASGAEDGAGASSAAESEGNDDITSDWRWVIHDNCSLLSCTLGGCTE